MAPHHEQWERDKIVDRGVWLDAGKQGFLGMAVPEEYGGGNPDFRYNTIVTEEVTAGRFSGIGFGLHNDVVVAVAAGEDFLARRTDSFPAGQLRHAAVAGGVRDHAVRADRDVQRAR